ncbi:uncharacterized protein LOC122960159 isoform X1 [Acropora millepora]|uniref:uncharacterized protein LOC122960159 isoform X1 n=1 Tax=Acropora millepora TaxID=45264 RepID=UPI001CF569E0|nr:uncharacterized protein LOC122960159 isoform X1 [Acropora millepora]
MSSADRFRLNSTRSFPLLMECQFVSDVKLGPSACKVQCRTSGQETPSTRQDLCGDLPPAEEKKCLANSTGFLSLLEMLLRQHEGRICVVTYLLQKKKNVLQIALASCPC